MGWYDLIRGGTTLYDEMGGKKWDEMRWGNEV